MKTNESSKSFLNKSLDFKIEGDKGEIYKLTISNSLYILNVNITKENSSPKIEYSKEFDLKELSQISKFFKVFDDIQSVINALKEIFEAKKPKIKEENECIILHIIPILSALGESNLIIPKKKLNDKEKIKELYSLVNKQGIEIESLKKRLNEIELLKNRLNILEEKFKLIEENPPIIRMNSFSDLIGDVIKTKEQYNLICGWISKEKKLKFNLLYKGTIDGDTINIFHQKCDNKGSTISIIESSDRQIFGGYANKSWDKNNNEEIPDNKSFLFNINIKKKFLGSNNNMALMPGNICSFGGNGYYELWLNDKYFSEKGGCYYGPTYNFKNFEITGGKDSFCVKEVEVYKVDEC